MFVPGSNSAVPSRSIDDLDSVLDNIPQIDDDDDDATDASQCFSISDLIMPSLSLDDNISANIRVKGWLNSSCSSILPKRGKQSRRARYFILRGKTLSYYARPHDIKAKGTFILTNGCSVGPVVFGTLEGHDQSIDDQQRENSTNIDESKTPNNNIKLKKNKGQYYCIRVSWPTNYKPTKDERFIAQARAQVAAENENKALQEQQHHEDCLDESNHKTAKSSSSRSILHRRIPSSSRSLNSPKPSPFRTRSVSTMKDPPALPDFSILNKDDTNVTNSNSKNIQGLPIDSNLSDPSGDGSINADNPPLLTHETGLHKHYTQQIEKHAKDQQKSQEELQKVMLLVTQKANHEKNKKRFIQGTGVAALSTAAITAGVLTAGMSLAAGLLFVGITAAAGGSGAVVGSKVYDKAQKENQKSFHLILGASTFEAAIKWKLAIEHVIQEISSAPDVDGPEKFDDQTSWLISSKSNGDGEKVADVIFSPRSRKSPTILANYTNEKNDNNGAYIDLAPKWVPLQCGGIALWGVVGFCNLRIFREERPSSHSISTDQLSSSFAITSQFRSDVGLAGHPFPPHRASIVLKAKTLDAFMCLMCSGRIPEGPSASIPLPNSGQVASFRIIETINDHTDVIHLVFRPLYLFPIWTAPRDFVLYRFWKYDDDGSYQICFESRHHRDCPPIVEYVRGVMHSVYTIAPLRRRKRRTSSTSSTMVVSEECLMSNTVQVDPRGWVPCISSLPFVRGHGYGDAFAVMALNQMPDVKDALDSVRFVAVQMNSDPISGGKPRHDHPKLLSKALREPMAARTSSGERPILISTLEVSPSFAASEDDEHDVENYDFQYSKTELPLRSCMCDLEKSFIRSIQSPVIQKDAPTIYTHPSPTISDWWAEPDANSFRVRGKSYKSDNRKINAGSSLFRLIAADIIETDAPILNGMCLHPTERVQLALARESHAASTDHGISDMPTFVFCVNISMPGPPNYHLVFYYAVDDLSMINGSDGSPSSKLCNEFIFGQDDTFRDNTFKLIPQIIEGNFMVRKAVGSTPAIMGNKIKQTYIKSERFFELTIDTGSSAVAAGVIRICNGYAKMIVVDLAFLFEGYNETTLPERVLGCVRLKNVEFGKKLRFVKSVKD